VSLIVRLLPLGCRSRHRSGHRLVSFADGKVTFRWRDSAHNSEQKLLTLAVDEFLRRFLLHLLPQGFVRIRNFGFLANRRRATTLPLCFQLLGSTPQTEQEVSTASPSDLWTCPQVRWSDAGHRKTYGCRDPAAFSTGPGCRSGMSRPSTSRNLLRASARSLAFCLFVHPSLFPLSQDILAQHIGVFSDYPSISVRFCIPLPIPAASPNTLFPLLRLHKPAPAAIPSGFLKTAVSNARSPQVTASWKRASDTALTFLANFRIARQHGKQAVASWKPHSISIACAHSVPGRGILRTQSLGIPVQ